MDSEEKPKRLAPTRDTASYLFAHSGNQCAFPGCKEPLFSSSGAFVGQLCHIEAALPGGERFNPSMTNDERRARENLVLMCYGIT